MTAVIVPPPTVAGGLATAGVAVTAWAIAAGAGEARRIRVTHRLGPSRAARPVPVAVADRLHRAGIPAAGHRTAVHAWVGIAVVAAVAGTLSRAAVPLAVLVTVGPPAAVLAAQGRAERQRRRDLPAVIDATVAAMRAGHSLAGALAEAGRGGGGGGGRAHAEFGAMARTVAAGTPLITAVERWAGEHDDRDTRLAAAALAVAAEAGGPGADGLEAAAASIRERAGVDAEIHALSVQARASAAMLTLTPVVFTGLLTSVDPSAARFLLGSRVGWLCLGVGLALDALGAWWMHRLVARAR